MEFEELFVGYTAKALLRIDAIDPKAVVRERFHRANELFLRCFASERWVFFRDVEFFLRDSEWGLLHGISPVVADLSESWA